MRRRSTAISAACVNAIYAGKNAIFLATRERPRRRSRESYIY